MSAGARWTLGSFALLFAMTLIFAERIAPSKSPLLVYGPAAFCLVIAVSCFSRTWRRPAVRIIGLVVFIAYVSYLVEEVLREATKHYTSISEPHWLNALIGLAMFGLPGLYVAVRGIYPEWGWGARAFNGDSMPPPDQEPERDDKPKS